MAHRPFLRRPRVSLVVGTHTHVPTADSQILPGGTAYQTDAGMCGDYDTVIGMQKDEPVRRFITQDAGRAAQAGRRAGDGLRRLRRDRRRDRAWRAGIEPVRIGGRLDEACPLVARVPSASMPVATE